MALNDRRSAIAFSGAARPAAPVEEGLRVFMLSVYTHMAAGITITGAVALGTFMLAARMVHGSLVLSNLGQLLYNSPYLYVVIFSPFVVALFMRFGAANLSTVAAHTLFYVYAALFGLSLSMIFLVYTGSSVARVFFITAATFGALSLYGYTTKRDLSAMATFLLMGLFGLVIGSVVNLFLGANPFQFALSVGGVLIFAGLTAWDTQELKTIYMDGHSQEESEKLAIYGALDLYVDFIGIFIELLRPLADRC